jgi:hypothetical protein
MNRHRYPMKRSHSHTKSHTKSQQRRTRKPITSHTKEIDEEHPIRSPATILVKAKRVVVKQSNKKKSSRLYLNRRDSHSEKKKIEEYIRRKRSKEKVEMTPDPHEEWKKYISWKQQHNDTNTCVRSLRSLRQFLLDGLHTEFPNIYYGRNNILQYYGLRNAIEAVIQSDKKSDICPKHIPDHINREYQKELYGLIYRAYRNADDLLNSTDPGHVMVKMFIIQALSTKHQLISDVYVEQMLNWYRNNKKK